MNRRVDGPRPGQAVCRLPQKNSEPRVGMLGNIYNNNRQSSTTQKVNGLAVLQSHDSKLTSLEKRLEQIENSQALNISGVENQIDLLKGDYKQTMKVLRGYIKELEKKIDTLTSVKMQLPTKKVENNDTLSENIVLEINETK